jgi:hypothetical protein
MSLRPAVGALDATHAARAHLGRGGEDPGPVAAWVQRQASTEEGCQRVQRLEQPLKERTVADLEEVAWPDRGQKHQREEPERCGALSGCHELFVPGRRWQNARTAQQAPHHLQVRTSNPPAVVSYANRCTSGSASAASQTMRTTNATALCVSEPTAGSPPPGALAARHPAHATHAPAGCAGSGRDRQGCPAPVW